MDTNTHPPPPPRETAAAKALRLLGDSHHGAGSRLGDLGEALRRLEEAQGAILALRLDLQDWADFSPIPRRRCGVCGHLSVVEGYVCGACGTDPGEAQCGECDPDYQCECPPPPVRLAGVRP